LTDGGTKYEMYGGHITLAAIYEFMCENKDELIFFDDCSNIVTNIEIMELLKQALQTSSKRRLHYRSHGVKSSANMPKSFQFNGRIIMAFNTMDHNNPNVRAIRDRAPTIELKYSRDEIYKAMYKIAENDGGGLMEYEKMIVTKEIETYTKNDISLEISLRRQALSFKLYAHFKKLYGEGNNEWKPEVKKIFGKKKESEIRELVRDIVGNGRISRKELVKQLSIKKNMSPRTAQRRINEYLEINEIYQNKLRDSDISVKPFKWLLGW